MTSFIICYLYHKIVSNTMQLNCAANIGGQLNELNFKSCLIKKSCKLERRELSIMLAQVKVTKNLIVKSNNNH